MALEYQDGMIVGCCVSCDVRYFSFPYRMGWGMDGDNDIDQPRCPKCAIPTNLWEFVCREHLEARLRAAQSEE